MDGIELPNSHLLMKFASASEARTKTYSFTYICTLSIVGWIFPFSLRLPLIGLYSGLYSPLLKRPVGNLLAEFDFPSLAGRVQGV